jgi:hypothetical protein
MKCFACGNNKQLDMARMKESLGDTAMNSAEGEIKLKDVVRLQGGKITESL